MFIIVLPTGIKEENPIPQEIKLNCISGSHGHCEIANMKKNHEFKALFSLTYETKKDNELQTEKIVYPHVYVIQISISIVKFEWCRVN